MPELPEVETTLRGIQPHIDKKIVTQVKIHNANLRWPVDKSICRLLKHQSINRLFRRGKYLLLEFDCGTLLIHLGMSGSLRVVDIKEPLQKHDHFELNFENNKSLRLRDPRRFGSVLWTVEPWQQHIRLINLGPEPLSDEFYPDYLYEKSRNRSIAIKSFVMNSNIVVGVGNIYASESLFIAGIRPELPASKVSKSRYLQLNRAIKIVLSQAIDQGGTTLKDFSAPDGNPGYFAQKLNVYGREGEKCNTCGRKIKNLVINQRATYFCTKCQR